MEQAPAWQADLSAHLSAPIRATTPLAGGACQENFLMELEDGSTLVLRSDAESSLPGSLRRSQEAPVIEAAVKAGVPTPAVIHVAPNLIREGSDALVMGFAEGVAIGAKVVRDPALAAAREALPGQLAEALVRIHSITPDQALPLETQPHSTREGESPSDAALRFCRTMFDALPLRPDLEAIYRWLALNQPALAPTVLVHGDYRVGNFLVTPSGLTAVLDWEFAHWGSAACDIGWLATRDWRFGGKAPVAGLVDRQAFLTLYQEAGGRSISLDELRWWEVMGNLRWAAGALLQTERLRDGTSEELELAAIGPRAHEMTFEAMRLITPPALAPLPEVPPAADPADTGFVLAQTAKWLSTIKMPDRTTAFQAKVAAYLLSRTARDQAHAPALEALESQAIAPFAPSRSELAEALRSGKLDDELLTVLAALGGVAGARAKVGNPRFKLQ